METIGLYVSVPLACFRVPRAREYFETFPCPPPSTVYGMLLSMVGEINRRKNEGAEIAIAMLSEPVYSEVLRTVWRVKNKNDGLGLGNNRRPDFQELLTDIRFAVWVRKGMSESSENPLVNRLQTALDQPSSVSRFGSLALGESTHLVDEVTFLSKQDDKLNCQGKPGRLLIAEDEGNLSLPIWPDHVGSATTWRQYRLVDFNFTQELPEKSWTAIKRTSEGF